MYYINQTADTSGNHGNPVSHQTEGMVALPESLLSSYIETMGFCYLVVEEETVTAVTLNQEAYDAYQTEHQNDGVRRAEQSYEPGEYLTVEGTMYRVLLPIYAGAQITPGTNVEETTIEAELAALTEEV